MTIFMEIKTKKRQLKRKDCSASNRPFFLGKESLSNSPTVVLPNQSSLPITEKTNVKQIS